MVRLLSVVSLVMSLVLWVVAVGGELQAVPKPKPKPIALSPATAKPKPSKPDIDIGHGGGGGATPSTTALPPPPIVNYALYTPCSNFDKAVVMNNLDRDVQQCAAFSTYYFGAFEPTPTQKALLCGTGCWDLINRLLDTPIPLCSIALNGHSVNYIDALYVVFGACLADPSKATIVGVNAAANVAPVPNTPAPADNTPPSTVTTPATSGSTAARYSVRAVTALAGLVTIYMMAM